ncbi:MAG: malate dehydrogenase, partial [Sulfolobales archaeon]|nr:malate dehydrogenase [Sulfolobales archaeon]
EDYIIPRMTEWEVYPRVAAAVGVTAVSQGVARIRKTFEELHESAKAMLERTRRTLASMEYI